MFMLAEVGTDDRHENGAGVLTDSLKVSISSLLGTLLIVHLKGKF
jgi:hypothetical protein